jgi:hypothetical protein
MQAAAQGGHPLHGGVEGGQFQPALSRAAANRYHRITGGVWAEHGSRSIRPEREHGHFRLPDAPSAPASIASVRSRPGGWVTAQLTLDHRRRQPGRVARVQGRVRPRTS